jgi:hypothetical protein
MRKATSGRRAGFFPVTLAWLLGQRKRLRVRQNNSPSPPISREHRRRTTDRRMAGGSRSGARIAKVKVRAKRRTFVGGSLEVVRLPLMRMMFAGRRVGRQARRRSSRLTPEDHRHRHVPYRANKRQHGYDWRKESVRRHLDPGDCALNEEGLPDAIRHR